MSLTFPCERNLTCDQYIIANLGFSPNFGGIDFDKVKFPATMKIDYVRVYQPSNARNIGCDPEDAPTMTYIKTYVVRVSRSSVIFVGADPFAIGTCQHT